MLTNLQQLPATVWLAAIVLIVVTAFAIWLWRRKYVLETVTFKTPIVDVEVARGEPPPPTPAGAPTNPAHEFSGTIHAPGGVVQTSLGDGARNIQAARDYYEKAEIHIEPLKPERPPAGSGSPPRRAAHFVPRGKIMDDLRAALRDRTTAAIVGVGGMGGVGKTELAQFLRQELENELPASTIWIDIATRPLTSIQDVLKNALGIQFPPNLDAHARYEILRAALRANPRTLFFDDVPKSFIPSLQFCLPPSPPCAALITSRQHELGLPAGAVRELDVMTEPESLELLRAVPQLAQALELFRAVGDRLGEANVLLSLGAVDRSAGKTVEAKSRFQTALTIYESIGERYSRGRALYRLGDCLADEKNWAGALEAYRLTAEIWQSIGLAELIIQILEARIKNVEKQSAE